MKGKYIILEGIDGSGKTGAKEYLELSFAKELGRILFTREPGGTIIGQKIRKVLMHQEISPEIELMLFFLDRAVHMQQKVLPAIQSGIHVISDRSYLSTYAYQIAGRQRPELVEIFEELRIATLCDARGNLLVKPNVILIEVKPEISLARKEKSKDGICTKFDAETLDFHKRVRAGFYEAIKQGQYGGSIGKLCIIENNNITEAELHKQILNVVSDIMKGSEEDDKS